MQKITPRVVGSSVGLKPLPVLLTMMAAGTLFGFVGGLLLAFTGLPAQINRIQFNNQNLFLSGVNLAWSSFADDIGPDPTTPATNHFADVFSQIRANGGNSMRLWLHTTGAITPAWNGNTVTGPGNNTIADLKTILDIAWTNKVGVILCLWSFDMLRINNGTNITRRAQAILTNSVCRQAYITNCLVPMVQALKGHPAIIAWEIFNEPEGMSDEFGWSFNYHVPMAAIQAFINQCAGAIHQTDPKAKVTNGSWSFYAATEAGTGNHNYYSDWRLLRAGGDTNGYLDFYTVHYYDWAGTARSPFQYPCSYWQLDKPLVIAEFYPPPYCNYCGDTPYENLYENGYAGALTWSWTDVYPPLMLDQLAAMYSAHPADVYIIDTGMLRLSVSLTTTNTAIVSWPSPATGWNLQQNADLATTNWITPPENVCDDGTNKYIIVTAPGGAIFYRLYHQ